MYEDLLSENADLLRRIAQRYAGACLRDRAVDVEDLEQAGFFGLVRASQTYAADKGSWTHWATLYITHEIHTALGRRDGQWVKAHTGAESLDAPVDEEGGVARVELVPDDSLEPIDAGAIRSDDGRVVREAVAALADPRQRAVVERWKLAGESQERVGKALGVSGSRVHDIWIRARKNLSSDARLRAIVAFEDGTPYHCRVGSRTFNTTNTSAVERAVLWRIDHEYLLHARPGRRREAQGPPGISQTYEGD